MYKVKHNLRNFERCQQLIELSTTAPLPQSELLGFISWADRNTLRMGCYYRPLQTLLLRHTPALIALPSLAKSPRLLCKASAIFGHLNLYSSAWMSHAAASLQKWLHAPHLASSFQDLSSVYKVFVELQEPNQQQFLQDLREKLVGWAEKEIEGAERRTASQEDRLRTAENIHKLMRTVLLDPAAEKECLWTPLQKMHRFFESSRLQAEFSDYPYNHSAHFLELLRLHPLAAQLPRGHYLSFLEGSFSANCGFGSRRTRESSGREFERRGESIFEMRFQRHLQEHGYWFERNVRIGLSEYDIVVKGRLSEEFRPFAASAHAQEVDCEQLALFQKMTSLWSIDRKQRRSRPLVVSLNGPYHFVQGDRQGLTRSEEVKSQLLEYYGYAEGRTVDYREWERETTNQEAVKQFLQRLLK